MLLKQLKEFKVEEGDGILHAVLFDKLLTLYMQCMLRYLTLIFRLTISAWLLLFDSEYKEINASSYFHEFI